MINEAVDNGTYFLLYIVKERKVRNLVTSS